MWKKPCFTFGIYAKRGHRLKTFSILFLLLQIFQVLEFPNEEESMTTLQNLVIVEREEFLRKIYNMTSGLNSEEMEALKSYILYGPDFDASDYDVRTIMLNTNRLVPEQKHTQVSLITRCIMRSLTS